MTTTKKTARASLRQRIRKTIKRIKESSFELVDGKRLWNPEPQTGPDEVTKLLEEAVASLGERDGL